MLCFITLCIALLFLYGFRREFIKSSLPQEVQFCQNFEYSYIDSSLYSDNFKDDESLSSPPSNIIIEEIIHYQTIQIKKATVIRTQNHITCYEDLNLENKGQKEMLNELRTIRDNHRIEFSYEINDHNFRVSCLYALYRKEDLCKALKNGFRN
jgi:hypothetical protein